MLTKKITASAVNELLEQGKTITEIANLYNCHRSTVYRVVGKK